MTVRLTTHGTSGLAEVHTSRVFTFAVASTDVADEWVAILSSMIQKRNSHLPAAAMTHAI